MGKYRIDLRRPPKPIYPIALAHDAVDPHGNTLGFTNYYLERNGRPLFGVCGEFHFSRYARAEWDAELAKIAAGGVNVVATYVFWNHHEELEGRFRWDGDRDLRHFVELCGRHGLMLIVRVGPFAHGECRNGGFPDWLYGRPFELRADDPDYLRYVRRLYMEIAAQLRGQFWTDGGPIVAVQLENEFMHAGAPWEVAPRQAREFVPAGSGGAEHLRTLLGIARETGLRAPFYTSTGWGGAPVLEGAILPLFGGYAFCPWNVTAERPEHAPTREYLFRSWHDNAVAWERDQPPYPPESYPFACCEMGGGMQVWYQYRFEVPAASVEAMTVVKIAGGCNFVGYYMYHGGTNPVGERGFLNEHVTPRLSYDFQAPLGEWGQVRESYRALRLLHLFVADFAEVLCPTATVLPVTNAAIEPTNAETLRFAARVHGASGFLFLNNYQDHASTRDLHGLQLTLELADETIELPRHPDLVLRRDVAAILPFGLDLQGARLVYATAQLVTRLEHAGTTYYVFFAPDGMRSELCFERRTIVTIAGADTADEGDRTYVDVAPGLSAELRIATTTGQQICIRVLPRATALQLSKLRLGGREHLVLTDADVIPWDDALELRQAGDPELSLRIFPPLAGTLRGPDGALTATADGFWSRYEVALPPADVPLAVRHIAAQTGAKARVQIDPRGHEQLADILLKISYHGDVGSASIAGTLVHDNFANGTPWEIALGRLQERLAVHPLDLHIAPLQAGKIVMGDGAMARAEQLVGQEIAAITAVEAVPIYRAHLSFEPAAEAAENHSSKEATA